jgi:Ca2+-binding RTX toxin-like protein
VLFGGSGNDMLIGGRGKDTLTGDRGADQFVFGAGDGRDTVTDFEDGIDRIVISSGAAGMNDLTLASVRGGATVAFGTVEIMLAGETLATITAADFDFV